jgi:ribonucleoside-diphosphate reductase alpha chain
MKMERTRMSTEPHFGPTLEISKQIHAEKYRSKDETFREAMNRIAATLKDSDEHYKHFRDILLNQRFLPAGRVQSAIGATRVVTAFNCFVSRTVEDSMDGIMKALADAAQTMRMGGGIGYDFSHLRPRGTRIKSLDSIASGPVSFMEIFDALCGTISSAGHRRGAQMGVLRCDHPDIEEFVHAKQNTTRLRNFNISVAVTDAFILAVQNDTTFDLVFEGQVHKTIRARPLWEQIMRSNWDWAEPGVLFIDRINEMNNLWYCEDIEATNPCAEQALPPFGACLLGSFNLTKYIHSDLLGNRFFNWDQFYNDIPSVVRAMDNVTDRTVYPLPEQATEAAQKRRMGLGYTGLANAAEALGFAYGSPEFQKFHESVAKGLFNAAYAASALIAKEKGSFPLYDAAKYLRGKTVNRLDPEVLDLIRAYGIRNSHLTSIAPTGTISLTADNVSSGIEPVFSYFTDRTIRTMDGEVVERVEDYGYRVFGVKGKLADECTADDHLNALITASRWVDSAVSKTCNVSSDMPWEDFKNLYMRAWEEGCKGCTTFNPGGKRMGILIKAEGVEETPVNGTACSIDAAGNRSCE